jgi:hypothetical protein
MKDNLHCCEKFALRAMHSTAQAFARAYLSHSANGTNAILAFEWMASSGINPVTCGSVCENNISCGRKCSVFQKKHRVWFPKQDKHKEGYRLVTASESAVLCHERQACEGLRKLKVSISSSSKYCKCPARTAGSYGIGFVSLSYRVVS